jgi:hypothetical protein
MVGSFVRLESDLSLSVKGYRLAGDAGLIEETIFAVDTTCAEAIVGRPRGFFSRESRHEEIPGGGREKAQKEVRTNRMKGL